MQHLPTGQPMTALVNGQEGHRSAASLPVHPTFTNRLGTSYPGVEMAIRSKLFRMYDNRLKLDPSTRARSNEAAHRFTFPFPQL